MPKGDGGGPLVFRVELDEAAALELKRRSGFTGPRYTKEQANATASALLRELAAHQTIWIDDDIRATLPFLRDARAMCWDEAAQHGLETLILAISSTE